MGTHVTETRSATKLVAAITGGSSGIGLATAIRFVQAGYGVAISGRDRQRLLRGADAIRQASAEGQCLPIAVDLSDASQANAFINQVQKQYGGMDILVNSAGSAKLAKVSDLEPAAFDSMLRDNLGTTFHTCRAAIPYLRQRGGGVIVNVSSLAAVDPFPGFAVYGACKAWMDLFSQALAAELVDDQIAVFSLRPGAVETPMLRGLFPSYPAEKALAPAAVAEVIWQLTDKAWMHTSGAAIPVRLP